jgi:hypothetical protein
VLTLVEAYSRFLLRAEVLVEPTGRNVEHVLDAAFQEFGLPTAMRSDNGPPFASTGAGGLTELSAQQRAIDLWRKDYNEHRPHEALGMRSPVEVQMPFALSYARPADVRRSDMMSGIRTIVSIADLLQRRLPEVATPSPDRVQRSALALGTLCRDPEHRTTTALVVRDDRVHSSDLGRRPAHTVPVLRPHQVSHIDRDRIW